MLVNHLVETKTWIKIIKIRKTYRDFKDWPRRSAADNLLAFNIAKNPKYYGYQRGITSMI